MLEDVDPEVAEAVRAAIEAVDETETGALDDLVLLERLLELGDPTVLRALGSRSQLLLKEAAAARRTRDADGTHWGLPEASDVLRFAASEASDLGGWGSTIGAIHVLLALFAFQGSQSEAVLRTCGLDWRPLRSVTRRQSFNW